MVVGQCVSALVEQLQGLSGSSPHQQRLKQTSRSCMLQRSVSPLQLQFLLFLDCLAFFNSSLFFFPLFCKPPDWKLFCSSEKVCARIEQCRLYSSPYQRWRKLRLMWEEAQKGFYSLLFPVSSFCLKPSSKRGFCEPSVHRSMECG